MVSIEELGLSPKVTNVLIRNGVNTLEDLKNVTEEDVIYRFTNFGRKSLEELLEKMKELGIHFK